MLQQQRAEPATLMCVLDDEGDLGSARADRLVAGDSDQVVAERRDDRRSPVVVDHREPLDVALGQMRVGPEEPEVASLLRQPSVQGDQRGRVVGRDRAQMHRAAIGGHDIGLPLRRVRRHLPIIPWPPRMRRCRACARNRGSTR